MPMGTVTRYLVVLAAGICLSVAFAFWLGHDRQKRWDAGYEKATLDQQAAAAKILEQRRAEDAATREEIEKRDANYRAQILVTQNSLAVYAAESDRLRGYVETLRNRRGTDVPKTQSGFDGAAGKDWIGVFAECLADRATLVRNVAMYADRLKGLQDYVNGLPFVQPKK